MTHLVFIASVFPASPKESSPARCATAHRRQSSAMRRSKLVSFRVIATKFQEENAETIRHIFSIFSIYRTFKNRFAVQQHVVRAFQTTSQLLEIVKVPPFADSVSEGDVK